MTRSIEQQIEELQAGLENLRLGKDFELWDDDTIGSKDSGAMNFPFCGGRGYKTIRCPFDSGTAGGDQYKWGCYYRCTIMTGEISVKVRKIEEVIREFNS